MPFADLSHEGVPVGRVVACKPLAYLTRVHGACGLFIDGRELGRPICFRSWQCNHASTEELLRLIDVEVPAGFHATVVGGRSGEEPDLHYVHDGDGVVIRVGRSGDRSPTQVRSAASESEDLPWGEGDESESYGSRHHSSAERSRSPRRGPAPAGARLGRQRIPCGYGVSNSTHAYHATLLTPLGIVSLLVIFFRFLVSLGKDVVPLLLIQQ